LQQYDFKNQFLLKSVLGCLPLTNTEYLSGPCTCMCELEAFLCNV